MTINSSNVTNPIDATIGVYPSHDLLCRKKLFSALSDFFNVMFIPIDDIKASPLEIILFNATDDIVNLAIALHRRCLAYGLGKHVNGCQEKVVISFSDNDQLDSRLRNKQLVEELISGATLPSIDVTAGDQIFASCFLGPIWTVARGPAWSIEKCAISPTDLAPKEALWHRLRNWTFIALLPMLHFIRQVLGQNNWNYPSVKACLIIDDPNLHSTRYGYIDFANIADHARKYDYHVNIAMVPFDTFFNNTKAIDIFKKNKEHLSLSIHGVTHLKKEMLEGIPQNLTTNYILNGMRKIKAFEKATGLTVSKLMVPPHEAVARRVINPLLYCGFEALTISGKPYGYTTAIPENSTGAGFGPATLVDDGLPVILRDPIVRLKPEIKKMVTQNLILKAFLSQPLLFSAHHGNFKNGLDPIEQIVDFLTNIGNVTWCAPQEIMNSNYFWKLRDNELWIRPYSAKLKGRFSGNIKQILLDCSQSYVPTELYAIDIHPNRKNTDQLSIEIINKNLNLHAGNSSYIPFLPICAYGYMRRIFCELRDRTQSIIFHSR
jgi:hypothetical protein